MHIISLFIYMCVCVLYVVMSCSYLIKDIGMFFNSLWPSGVIWWSWFWSILAEIMACCLTAWGHRLNKDRCFIANMFCNINLKAISQEDIMNLTQNMCSGTTLLKLLPHLPGASELTAVGFTVCELDYFVMPKHTLFIPVVYPDFKW